MIAKGVNIDLLREQQQFKATLAFVEGNLKNLEAYVNLLHPQERVIYEEYQYQRRKKSYLLGRLAAKQAIVTLSPTARPDEIWIDSGVFQFPVVKTKALQNIQVSISHCDDIGFCVAYPESHPIGVDLERISPANTKTTGSQLTDQEKLILSKDAPQVNYVTIFSLKEALSKVLKTGMMLDFKLLEIDSISINGQELVCTFKNFGQYKAHAYLQGGYTCSVVLPRKTNVNMQAAWQMLDSIKSSTQG